MGRHVIKSSQNIKQQAAKPLVSVVMPVFNTRTDFLKAAVQSVLSQTFINFELLIIDDGSAAEISNILDEFRDSRIRRFRLETTHGAAYARNIALKSARGEYIAFLDSDDLAYPSRLEVQYSYLESHPEIGVLGTAVDFINMVNPSDSSLSFPKIYDDPDLIEETLIVKGNVFCMSSMMLRKSLLILNGITFEDCFVPGEDYRLWCRLVGKTVFNVIPEVLGAYRWYPENISNIKNNLQREKCKVARFSLINDLFCFKFETLIGGKKISLLESAAPYSLPPSGLKAWLDYAQNCLEFSIERVRKGEFEEKRLTQLKKILKRPVRSCFFHTHKLSRQIVLLRHPLPGKLGIPLYVKLLCLFTRLV